MNPDIITYAPGWPGIDARWTSSAKDGVGTALGSSSRLWFALSHGILNEVYYPRVDQACTRDLELIITDGVEFFSEEKRDTETIIEMIEPGVPLFRITNRCRQGRYGLVKEVFTDPQRDCLVQRIRFEKWSPILHLHALLSPHIGNHGMGNTAWVGDYKGTPMLFANRDGVAMALGCSTGWEGRSVGFVGMSDGWQDLNRSKRMTWFYDRAENGNLAMTGEISLPGGEATEVCLVLGFGRHASEAGHRARATMAEDLDTLCNDYIAPWREWQGHLSSPSSSKLYRTSTAVLRTHEDKRFYGGNIASLSIPWGASKGDNDLGGYHLVWPRDLVETAGGYLAAGAHAEAKRILTYLRTTQEADGHWPQNMWLDGTPYWGGIQMLVDLAFRNGALAEVDLSSYWPMVQKAASYIVNHGPSSAQDRWEEDSGCSPFTLAAEIASLVVAAELASLQGEDEFAHTALETADKWHAKIDDWTYARNTDLARAHDVEGYYVRISPPEVSEAGSPLGGFVAIKNRPLSESLGEAVEIVSPDALALVRFGLRAADDPRILNTIKVVDALLKRDLPAGPAWCRYNGDGYGEHEDGSPFDGTGCGRPWPLLTGERAHYELARGDGAASRALAETIERFAAFTGLLPEQVWDANDLPERELFRGRPTGSAMPLVWAHAEYIKLVRSLQDGVVFDLPPQTVARYLA